MTLFLTAFLAATLLPLGSEWLVIVELEQGKIPWMVWLLATAGNTLGGIVNYLIGRFLHDWLEVKGKTSTPAWQRAESWFQCFGIWSLLLAWIPIVGDPLTLVAGVLKAPPWLSFLLILIGKAGRYGVLILAYLQLV